MAPGATKPSTLLFFVSILFSIVSAHNIPCSPPTLKGAPKCPRDTLKFGVCGSWLGLVTEVVGAKPSPECCTLIKGLADLEAAACLCTAVKANVMGVVKAEVPVAVSSVLNGCGKKIPRGFVC